MNIPEVNGRNKKNAVKNYDAFHLFCMKMTTLLLKAKCPNILEMPVEPG